MKGIYQRIADLSSEERELFELLFKKEGLNIDQLPILRRTEESFPLSFSQERVWTVGQLSLNLPCENVAIGFRISGPLDLGLFERALNAVAQRHEMLRAACLDRNGKIVQTVAPRFECHILCHDLRQTPEELRWEVASEAAEREARRPFDPIHEPLLRMVAWRLGEHDFLLAMVTHQLLLDGWSVQVLLREIAAFYTEWNGGAPACLPELPIQYGDFAVWQRDLLEGEVLETQMAYWKEQLGGAPSWQELPLDHPRSNVPSFEAATRGFHFSEDVSNALRELSRSEGATLFMTLLAAFQTVLHKYSGRHDAVMGTAISNRTRSETEKLIGNFANNLLLRTSFSGNPTFRDLLARVRTTVTDAFANQELPLEHLARSLHQESARHTIPKFHLMFILRDFSPEECLRLPDLRVQLAPIDTGVSRLDLNLDIKEGAHGLRGTLTYKSKLFEEETISRMLSYLESLCAIVASDPRTTMAELPEPPTKAAPVCRIDPEQISTPGKNVHRSSVPPRDALENQLRHIWERILGIEPIGVTDTFFELGGHSLLAVSLFSEIERAFGRKLPLAVLFQAPTIEQLAGVLRKGQNEVSWSCLVPIRAQGTKVPLFLVHAIGGNLLNYKDLVGHLDPDQPVYGLQSQGLDGKTSPHTRVEDMAAQYIREIREVIRDGPYRLAGTSFGGVLAYEMARQLTALGLSVGALVLLDAYHLHYSGRGNFRSKVRSYLERLRFHFENLLFRANRIEYIQSRFAIASGRIRRIIRNRTWEVAHSYYQLSGRPLPPALHRVNDANHYAFRTYVPQPYEGRVILFRSMELSVAHSFDPEAAWRGLAKGGLDLHDVPGNHVTSMLEPHVRQVAEKLASCLEQAQLRPAAAA